MNEFNQGTLKNNGGNHSKKINKSLRGNIVKIDWVEYENKKKGGEGEKTIIIDKSSSSSLEWASFVFVLFACLLLRRRIRKQNI